MAQKYIIGDLIKCKVGGLEFIAEITNTSKYGYCFKGVSDDISGTLCKEFAKDIPLTPEILQKNGWEPTKESLGHSFKNKKYPRFALWSINDKWNFTIDGVTVCNTLSCLCYVHELQHLLFGLNINHEMEV